jgi:hypothetical protein
MSNHGPAAGVSVVLGALIAVLTNVFTDGWAWPAGTGLAVAVAAMVAWEVRRSSVGGGTPSVTVTRTGSATAHGRGSLANSGFTGSPDVTTVRRTGDAHATDGGVANTGAAGPAAPPPV